MKKPTFVETKTPVSSIDCCKAFNNLDQREKLYAYYFTRASWEGNKICYFQRSYEAPALFYIINKIFALQTLEEVKAICLTNGFTEEEWTQLTAYLAAFLQNCGNYFSFGDNKFIPEISKDKFWTFIKESNAYKLESEKFEDIWKSIEVEIYTFTKPYGEIGFLENGGLSAYYSSNMTNEDRKLIQTFLQSISVSPLNTRVIKINDDFYKVLVCSYSSSAGKVYSFNNKKISLVFGDFSLIMGRLIHNLRECLKYTANDTQKQMLNYYIEHFYTGDINKHKDSQRAWIKNKNPIVETNIGFIEVYLDPARARAEFEAIVAIVDKEQSKKLADLVDHAEKIIPNLPWPKEFELDKLSKPDFTSLDVLAFASSGTWVGKNIPNYDDIRKTEGFKNFSLSNCYLKPQKENILFTKESDKEMIVKFSEIALFVKVSLHELLGHESGKPFMKNKDGKFNFDHENLKNPLTGGPITYYEPNETYYSKFGKMSSAMEECQSDAVALYLSCEKKPLEILAPGRESEWDDIVYIEWFDCVLAGFTGLKLYSTDTNQWGQAHITARFVILRVLLEAGNDFVKIVETEKDGKPYVYLTMDKAQIHTTGKQAIGNFLRKLQIYKSTADVEEGLKFFRAYAHVDEKFLGYRKIVLDNPIPRALRLQHDVILKENNQVEYVSFEESFEGLIKSQLFHHDDSFESVYYLWKEYKDNFRYKA